MSVYMIIYIIVFIICSIGIPLNGIVIWLLGFQIKRNPFMVLILNLAIADFGFLAILEIICICYFIHYIHSIHFIYLQILLNILLFFSCTLYISGLFLLTAISIDRCVAVLFPIWHRCSRPKHLSPVVCALIWICSFLLGGIMNILVSVFNYYGFSNLHLVVTAVLCLPLITISTLILFVKICIKPKQIKRGRLLVMISITLLCFLIFSLPLNIYGLYGHFVYDSYSFQDISLNVCLPLGGSLNSSVNPIIYYLVGRKK
ncbi:mas-related G-protein coupled receptor member H-like [Ahaetulla prasina]|uniref:mas-related G-protein coupled receptor member H-like n=1 Tax=Ahaetulla prasina TaxID=499056 RepID=UPI002647DC1C|nr:mas-related G-protein coupled receptor member H-like [Ahaetulla prasina]